MTPQNAAAIVDYRDRDDMVTPGGAEADDYAVFQPPYLPRNGPFRTTREVLLVFGLSREFFLGEDVNQNGLLDPEENDGVLSYPSDDGDGVLDPGWAGLVTVNSSAREVNAYGERRINIQSASERRLSSVPGITTEIATAMIAHRNQNRFESLADLLDVAAADPNQSRSQQSGRDASRGQNPPPSNAQSSTSSGKKLIDQELLMEIADYLTVNSEQNQAGAVNINTAQAAVLACLPGMTQELAEAVASYRQSAGFFDNIAWLLKVPGMNRQIFKQLAPRVTVRSETFRILSEGKVSSTGARKRLEAIVRVSSSSVETLSFREDNL
jgi:competence ComEA-like helix-hairpin-helix protein